MNTMATGKFTCKICGKEYNACLKWEGSEKFRWQDVACCPEHGAEYFIKVLNARGESIPESVPLFKDYLEGMSNQASVSEHTTVSMESEKAISDSVPEVIVTHCDTSEIESMTVNEKKAVRKKHK